MLNTFQVCNQNPSYYADFFNCATVKKKMSQVHSTVTTTAYFHISFLSFSTTAFKKYFKFHFLYILNIVNMFRK